MKLALSIFAAIFFSVTSAMAQTNRNVSQYNLAAGVAGIIRPGGGLPEGGSAAKKGLDEFRVIHSGVTYFFANAENAKTFEANPENMNQPMEDGAPMPWVKEPDQKSAFNPLSLPSTETELTTLSLDRPAEFDADIAGFEANADVNWTRISGESPRGQ